MTPISRGALKSGLSRIHNQGLDYCMRYEGVNLMIVLWSRVPELSQGARPSDQTEQRSEGRASLAGEHHTSNCHISSQVSS